MKNDSAELCEAPASLPTLKEIEDRINGIIDSVINAASALERSVSHESGRTRGDYFLSFNSVDLLEFIICIEREFGFQLGDDDLTSSKLRSLEAWAPFVRSRLSGQ
jgi:acyl carrier protein